MNVDLVPFGVPNFVCMKTPTGQPYPRAESPSFALSQLEAADLAKLCDEFRASVFKKANKKDPSITP